MLAVNSLATAVRSSSSGRYEGAGGGGVRRDVEGGGHRGCATAALQHRIRPSESADTLGGVAGVAVVAEGEHDARLPPLCAAWCPAHWRRGGEGVGAGRGGAGAPYQLRGC